MSTFLDLYHQLSRMSFVYTSTSAERLHCLQTYFPVVSDKNRILVATREEQTHPHLYVSFRLPPEDEWNSAEACKLYLYERFLKFHEHIYVQLEKILVDINAPFTVIAKTILDAEKYDQLFDRQSDPLFPHFVYLCMDVAFKFQYLDFYSTWDTFLQYKAFKDTLIEKMNEFCKSLEPYQEFMSVTFWKSNFNELKSYEYIKTIVPFYKIIQNEMNKDKDSTSAFFNEFEYVVIRGDFNQSEYQTTLEDDFFLRKDQKGAVLYLRNKDDQPIDVIQALQLDKVPEKTGILTRILKFTADLPTGVFHIVPLFYLLPIEFLFDASNWYDKDDASHENKFEKLTLARVLENE